VVNSTTGEPVRRATVAVLADADSHLVESVQSDAEGRFVLDRLPAGKYPLTASKRGYRQSFYDEHDEYNSAIVTGEGQDTGNLMFKLTPNAVLYGVVTGDGGDPVEGASVLLFERGGLHGGGPDKINEVDATTTDDRGAYEFGNLAAGEYLIAVSAQPWYAMHGRTDPRVASGETSQLDVAYPVTYYDSTMDEASATAIPLSEGGRQEADIAMHAVPALRLQVPVTRRGRDQIARPDLRQIVFGAQVTVGNSVEFEEARPATLTYGGLAPGKYQLTQGTPPRVLNLDLNESADVDPGSGVPAATVSGVLMSTSGERVRDLATVALEPVGEPRGRATMQAAVRQGEFHFDTVEAGTWSLSAFSTTQALPVVAIAGSGKGGQASQSGSQIVVKDQPVTLTAMVSLSLAKVQGFARREGKGVAGAMIVLVPKQPSAYRALVRRDQSDSDGSFSLRDVPAGQYTVIAIEDGWKLDWTERENMVRYLRSGVQVTVPEHTGAVVSLAEAVPVQARE
jgi:hypothetical protein